jgi:uncharacterized protein YoxC
MPSISPLALITTTCRKKYFRFTHHLPLGSLASKLEKLLDERAGSDYTTNMTRGTSTHSEETPLERLALRMTGYIGSPLSLIIHSLFFAGIFGLQMFGYTYEQIMLILTTIVSLEAIYLSIFIQITVNHQARQIKEVGEDVVEISGDVEEISKDIDGIQEDVEEISKDVEDISEDVEEISKDIDDIQEDVEEISKDVDDISEDVEEISKDIDGIQEDVEEISEDVEDLSEEKEKEEKEDADDHMKIQKIESALEELLKEIRTLPRK